MCYYGCSSGSYVDIEVETFFEEVNELLKLDDDGCCEVAHDVVEFFDGFFGWMIFVAVLMISLWWFLFIAWSRGMYVSWWLVADWVVHFLVSFVEDCLFWWLIVGTVNR